MNPDPPSLELPGGEPPSDLEVLGRIRLSRGGRPATRILAQPRRLALLVYLTVARSQGFIARDELLGVFWPDSTEDRARASLRQAIRFLRRHLGDHVIQNRGDDAVGIPPVALRCDAVEFRRAMERGDDAAAVDRYRGGFLPGMILSGAHAFDRWLHAERQALRTAAIASALRLADRSEAREDLHDAVRQVRWALALEPSDEAVARRLISLQARAGNRGAAQATYASLTSHLRDELDLEPSPETQELMAALRDGASPGVAGFRPLSPQRVLVLALRNLTGKAELATVGALAAEVTAQALTSVPELEVVPPMAAMGTSGGGTPPGEAPGAWEGDGAADGQDPSETHLGLARGMGAGTLVEGTFHLEGGQLHLGARITDVRNGRLLRAPDPARGPVTSPLEAIRALGERVATHLGSALTRRAVHLRGAAPPPGLEAYGAYLDGMERFIRGQWREALEGFQAASRHAPDYPLPRIVSAIALWNLEALPEARRVADEAAGLRGSVGRFESAVLDMVLAWLDGDWAGAHAAARVQAELAPGSIPHFQVAEEARRLNRPREAREVLTRLDPEAGELKGWIYYWMELAASLHLMGDHRRELEAAHRCRRLHPDDPAAALLEARAHAALGHTDDVHRVVDEVLALPGRRGPDPGAVMREAALELNAHTAPPAGGPLLERAVAWYQGEVTRRSRLPSGGGDERRTGDGEDGLRLRRERARTLYHAGRLDESGALFTELAEAGEEGVRPVGHHHGHLQGHLDAGYLALIAARRGRTEEAEGWCARLRSLDGPFLYGAQWFWLAAAAAVADRAEEAVALLRRAFAEGLPHELFVHSDPHLLRLRGNPAFDALLRPRG